VPVPWWAAVVVIGLALGLTRAMRRPAIDTYYGSRAMRQKLAHDTLGDDEKFVVDVSGGISETKRKWSLFVYAQFLGVTTMLTVGAAVALVTSAQPWLSEVPGLGVDDLETLALVGDEWYLVVFLMLLPVIVTFAICRERAMHILLSASPGPPFLGRIVALPARARPGGMEWDVVMFPALFILLSWGAVVVSALDAAVTATVPWTFAVAMTVAGVILAVVGAWSAGQLRTAAFLYNPLVFGQDLLVKVRLPQGEGFHEHSEDGYSEDASSTIQGNITLDQAAASAFMQSTSWQWCAGDDPADGMGTSVEDDGTLHLDFASEYCSLCQNLEVDLARAQQHGDVQGLLTNDFPLTKESPDEFGFRIVTRYNKRSVITGWGECFVQPVDAGPAVVRDIPSPTDGLPVDALVRDTDAATERLAGHKPLDDCACGGWDEVAEKAICATTDTSST
jgi:hypothetical protein